jgi:hypothetical protein
MEYDISDITDRIANIVRNANPDLDQCTNEQTHALLWISCINPIYGRWIDIGVEFVISALDLEDRDFIVRFPALSRLTKSDRQELIGSLKDHLRSCRHCAIKHDHELELNARIEKTLQENSGYILEELQLEIPLGLEPDHTETVH